MEDGASRHPVHRREDVAAAQQVLQTLDAEPHPPGLGDVDLILLTLMATLGVTDPPHVPQETEDAI